MISNEELKTKIIEYFGNDYLSEEKMLKVFADYINKICKDTFDLSPIPVLFDDIDGMISMLDTKEMIIIINRKYKEDKTTILAALTHELEHYYQIFYSNNFNTSKAKRWKKEMDNYINESNIEENQIQEIEIDAEAFAIVVLESELGLKYKNPDKQIQRIIEDYIKIGKLITDD